VGWGEEGRGGRTTSCPARIESRQTEHWMRVPSGAQALACRRSVCSSTVAAAWVVVRAAVVAWRVWARACTAPRSIAAHSPQSSCPPFLHAQASISGLLLTHIQHGLRTGVPVAESFGVAAFAAPDADRGGAGLLRPGPLDLATLPRQPLLAHLAKRAWPLPVAAHRLAPTVRRGSHAQLRAEGRRRAGRGSRRLARLPFHGVGRRPPLRRSSSIQARRPHRLLQPLPKRHSAVRVGSAPPPHRLTQQRRLRPTRRPGRPPRPAGQRRPPLLQRRGVGSRRARPPLRAVAEPALQPRRGGRGSGARSSAHGLRVVRRLLAAAAELARSLRRAVPPHLRGLLQRSDDRDRRLLAVPQRLAIRPAVRRRRDRPRAAEV